METTGTRLDAPRLGALVQRVTGRSKANSLCGRLRELGSRADSDGYDTDFIFEAVCRAARRVRDGNVAFERDAVAFNRIEYNYAILATLLRIARFRGNNLHVLDFRGSLGSTYFQCREFLNCVADLSWSIVEQPAFVACGNREFANEQLRFFANLENCYVWCAPDVVLLSSVIPYVERSARTASDDFLSPV